MPCHSQNRKKWGLDLQTGGGLQTGSRNEGQRRKKKRRKRKLTDLVLFASPGCCQSNQTETEERSLCSVLRSGLGLGSSSDGLYDRREEHSAACGD